MAVIEKMDAVFLRRLERADVFSVAVSLESSLSLDAVSVFSDVLSDFSAESSFSVVFSVSDFSSFSTVVSLEAPVSLEVSTEVSFSVLSASVLPSFVDEEVVSVESLDSVSLDSVVVTSSVLLSEEASVDAELPEPEPVSVELSPDAVVTSSVVASVTAAGVSATVSSTSVIEIVELSSGCSSL